MRESYGEIIRFAIVGTANFLIIMAVSWLLMHLFSINFYVANIAAYVLALVNNFYWNRIWVFRSTGGRMGRQALMFLAAYGIAYLVQLGVIAVLVQWVGVNKDLANFIGLFPFGATNFLLNKFFAFR